MGNYQFAQKYFDKILDASPDMSQAFYYSALSNIGGRRVMSLPLNEIRRIETFVDTAIQLDEDVPHYKLLLAMIRRDYYETNGMKIPSPNADALLAEIYGASVEKNEMNRLMETVKVANREYYLNKIEIA
jgi:tetratricopeptide (TPR) repeat protein